jgi:hypothetical protein
LPMLKDGADLVTRRDEGAGVRELIDRLLAADLRDLEPRLRRHAILLGTRADRTEVQLPPTAQVFSLRAHIFTSWNQMAGWIKQLEDLKRSA